MSTTSSSKQHARHSSNFSKSRPAPMPSSPLKRSHSDQGIEESSPLAVSDRPWVERPRASSSSSQAAEKTPARSFYVRSFHGQLDPAQYSSSAGLRDQTAELAAFALSENASHLGTSPPTSSAASDDGYPEVIEEVSEPVTPASSDHDHPGDPAVSELTAMIQNSMGQEEDRHQHPNDVDKTTSHRPASSSRPEASQADEYTALIGDRRTEPTKYGHYVDVERQYGSDKGGIIQKCRDSARRVRSCCYTLSHPKTWSARAIYREAIVHPVSLLPAVFLGLLLNILDALSYGMILFPLGNEIFEGLGSDGIAMFYVSTIVAQVVYSSGGSIFRGGIGSEMIEVVPFFHKMAFTILQKVGDQNPKAVLATTILSFAISSILTGVVFFLMGACKLGSLIGFFPRHILIGCIGGVGWFLVATGIEVSARLPGNLEYNLGTLKQLFRSDTIALWTVPLLLAITLLIVQRFVKSNLLVGGYFLSVAAIFYFFKSALGISMETLHTGGWVFDPPPAGNPWYHFYTLYDFNAVHWGALADTIPAMFALTFFGVLHVPINVPALGISTGEDNLSVDRELVAHGVSNCLSGLFGSVQNYLVYTNSLLFMDSGGNDRLAGLLLAACTVGILLAGPAIIGYIPIMVVGALIFLLGIELLEEALVGTWGKVHKLEYATILIIVVTMGVWDFVIGILVGILLAALSFVVQTSRRTAIRATYSGQVARSLVRRPPVQLKFLRETGKQIFLLRLAGYLFFGTIVGVENRIRALLEEDAFRDRPLRFLILDMAQINGIDFSAAEAFTRINRLLQKRGVELIVSNLDVDGEVGQALRNVGLFAADSNVQIFPDLNVALEHCENKLLTALYRQQEQRRPRRIGGHLDMPRSRAQELSSSYKAEFMGSSPRRTHLHQVAQTTLDEDTSSLAKWQSFKQPLPLMLQIFADLSDKNEDFWYRAMKYFERVVYPKGSVLFKVGDPPDGFYMLEEGILRCDYDWPQGKYSELIVSGAHAESCHFSPRHRGLPRWWPRRIVLLGG
ncbi:Cyclic nucleotide-binding domain-containing protein [Cladophialophora immunda]|nr:Cyclic nucleotide-binding domain-containing protein [Cladophialophora immunda]